MLTIRLFRTGKKGQPFYKIVVTDRKNAAHNGRFIEEVGVINPIKKDRSLKAERIKYWLKVGAKPSPTVYNLLITEKIVEGKKIANHAKSKKKEETKPALHSLGEGVPAAVSTPVSAPVVKETPVVEAKPEVKKVPVVEVVVPEVKAEPVTETVPEKPMIEVAPVAEVTSEESVPEETPTAEVIPEEPKEEIVPEAETKPVE